MSPTETWSEIHKSYQLWCRTQHEQDVFMSKLKDHFWEWCSTQCAMFERRTGCECCEGDPRCMHPQNIANCGEWTWPDIKMCPLLNWYP